ncbi:hypothetical protein G4G28_13835 [Massilia sp. Dwa41.01b]|uniref:hypothetical protein n=1 Tax=Massilia sp. Dwa41.01b TaxID=2709302 RepID=UPI001600FBCF|nr:hypothetical protein [Massilia sp. Dwa41.01b]QNA89275.1 hypothetical protein G4G28_13835 [Massilia sp. Dwa41.01b]
MALDGAGPERAQRVACAGREPPEGEALRLQRPQCRPGIEPGAHRSFEPRIGKAHAQDDLGVVRRVEHRQVRGVQAIPVAEQHHAMHAVARLERGHGQGQEQQAGTGEATQGVRAGGEDGKDGQAESMHGGLRCGMNSCIVGNRYLSVKQRMFIICVLAGQ